jgi:hypothetical protein
MPRPVSGNAKTGAERIAAFRARQREAGRVMAYVDAAGTPTAPTLDRRDPAALVQGWEVAIRMLRSIHRAASTWRQREAGLDADGSIIVDRAKYDAACARYPAEIREALDRIAEFDIIRLNRSERPPGRIARWENAISELREQLDYYQSWLENLPEAIRGAGSTLVDKLEAMAEFENAVAELEGADLPQGWGRD